MNDEGLVLLPVGRAVLRFDGAAAVTLRTIRFGEFVEFRSALLDEPENTNALAAIGHTLDWWYEVAETIGSGSLPVRSNAPLWLGSARAAVAMLDHWLSSPEGGPWQRDAAPVRLAVPSPPIDFGRDVRKLYHAAGQLGIPPSVVDAQDLWKVGAMLGAGLSDDEQGARRAHPAGRGLDLDDEKRARAEYAAYKHGEGPRPTPVAVDDATIARLNALPKRRMN